jgi:hypothetical protein
VTHQVHAVAGTGHQADIANRVQRAQFIKCQALMHKVNRHKLDSAETAIDTTNEFVDCCAQILVLLDILSRGHSELHKDNLSDPFWVLSEEELKCMELLRNTLDIIKPVDADDDFHAVKALLKGSDTLLNGLFLQVLWVQKISN